jgi:hypothetical protein
MSTVAPPPSTGKKKKARKVFGDSVADEVNSSLSYSPSPVKPEVIEETTNALATLFEEDGRNASKSSSGSIEKISAEPDKENDISIISYQKDSEKQESSMREQMRKGQRSPIRRDVIKKTQDAINKASESFYKSSIQPSFADKKQSEGTVNQSLIAARNAREALHRQKAKDTAKVRREWQEDAEDAKSFHEEAEKQRREMLGMQRQLSSKFNQQRKHNYMAMKQNTLQKIDEESQFNSSVYREHKKKLQ